MKKKIAIEAAPQPEQKPRAFIYCRTSDDAEKKEDATKVSIEEQEEKCRQLAQKFGYEVLDVFIDRNRSSKIYPTGFVAQDDTVVEDYLKDRTIPKDHWTRDGLGKLFSRLDEINVIIVLNVDRFMRSLELSKLDSHLLPMLRRRNIIIHSNDHGILDPKKSSEILIFKIENHVKSDDSEKKRIYSQECFKTCRRTGKLYSTPNFYGFRTAGKQKVRREKDEIEIIQQVFKDFLADKSMYFIARDLNTRHVKTLEAKKENGKDNPKWEACTIRAMLKRTHYAGFQYISKREIEKEVEDREEVQVPLFHPPVIDRDTFNKVQAKLANRKEEHTPRNCKDVHGLGGLVFCGICGFKLYTTCTYPKWGNKEHKQDSFRCNSYKKDMNKIECKGVQIREKGTAGLEYKSGQPYSPGLDDCLFPLVCKGYIKYLAEKARRVGLDDEIDMLKKKVNKSRSHILFLNQKQMENPANEDVFYDIIMQSINAGAENEKRLADLEKKAARIDRVKIPRDLFKNYASHQIPNAVKKELFESVVERIDVFREFVNIKLKNGGSFQLQRFKKFKTFILPSSRVVVINGNSRKEIPFSNDETNIPLSQGTYIKTNIKEDTHFDVVFIYENDDPIHLLYGDDNLAIFAEGNKKMPDSNVDYRYDKHGDVWYKSINSRSDQ